ncbi:MAG TPA: DNA-formamidopyrimidine glycosylase family protein [Motilibacterales bacterium]|nr:DNA-formamidopyrimidine glycosylase family protein [Motilibacterales bacterium]
MPELPEVTALAEALSARAVGLRVSRVEVAAISALKTFDPPVTAVAGCEVLGCSRRGKHLVLELVDPQGEPLYVVIHLSRAGWARWRDDPPAAPAPFGRRGGGRGAGTALALRIVFGAGDAGGPDGQPPGTAMAAIDVTEAGTQKRLAVHVVRDPAEVPAVARLGPDPLEDLTPALFHDVLAAAGRAQVKGVLRDQSRIAGIGNAYSDEILHAARMSPFAPAGTQPPEAEAQLFAAMRDTLGEAVSVARATDPAGLKAEKKAGMAVHGRTGQPCPVCGDVVREVSFADSSLQYCATCQTGGKPLADRRMSRLLK